MVFRKYMRHASSKKGVHVWVNVVCSVVIPSLIMVFLSPKTYLGPLWALLVALLFPIGYGIYERHINRRANFFSLIGFINVFLSGGVGALGLGPQWMIYKETGVPILIAIYLIASINTPYSFMKLLLNSVFDMDLLKRLLKKKKKFTHFYRLLNRCSYMLAGVYLINALLNFMLARFLITAPAGTVLFTKQVGHMTALSMPFITVPTLIMILAVLYYLFYGIKNDIDQSLGVLFR